MIYTNNIFSFNGACLFRFKTSKKIFPKDPYFAIDFAKSLFYRSRLKISCLKSLKFLYDNSIAFEKCNLNTDKTSL